MIGNGSGTIGRRWILSLVLFLMCMVMYILFSRMSLPTTLKISGGSWLPYRVGNFKDQNWFQRTCMKGVVPQSLEDFPLVIQSWRQTQDTDCRDLYLTFNKLVKVRVEKGELTLPKPFEKKVYKWMGNNEELMKEVLSQEVLLIRNLYTMEENAFNPLRNKRPVSEPDIPLRKYIEELLNKTKSDCDFCKYRDYTASEKNGRIESTYSYTASNAFKLDRWHGLVNFKSHHAVNWTKAEFIDLMDTMTQWFSQVHKSDPEYSLPSMVWDLFPKAGASQVHPHTHSFLDRESYQGTMELWREGALQYNQDFPHRNFFYDLIELHSILGLTVTYGKAVAFANIVPKKDNEIVIVSEKADEDFFNMWYFILRGYLEDMGDIGLCFSLGAAFPSLTGDVGSGSLPAYVRIVTRGLVSDSRSDVSSLEMFLSSSANADPYNVIKVMKNSVQKRSHGR
ncbi:uncharacterized protein LOC127832084 [Dreissena polymorpha]|uniref:uncharacterized protein LOC127832084 n=1 Tax=Dreissena polymorpha TaxID=45954 RepID=UPI002263DB1E|nr:uncharacterized protein LOC127832084 [Dreissena polymorpha]